mmetsp:Transcript_21966/g.44492  ORF Transcript_21966/g.44492 Transcript_21966/m.44492 type:complete len:220 (-) Transcript_21966:226-885(-)
MECFGQGAPEFEIDWGRWRTREGSDRFVERGYNIHHLEVECMDEWEDEDEDNDEDKDDWEDDDCSEFGRGQQGSGTEYMPQPRNTDSCLHATLQDALGGGGGGGGELEGGNQISSSSRAQTQSTSAEQKVWQLPQCVEAMPPGQSSCSGNRVVMHVDVDAFYCAVECIDDPSLLGKPLAVQQFNSGGFVAVSYEAKAKSIRKKGRRRRSRGERGGSSGV